MAIICPLCGEENCDDHSLCSNCGHHFTRQPQDKSRAQEKWIIRCPKCGKEYPVSGQDDRITECDFCEDEFDKTEIGNCVPEKINIGTLVSSPAKESFVQLTDIKSQTVITVKKDEIIGRDGTAARDFFAEQKTISKKHCRIYEKNGSWYIEHQSETNSTILNHIKLVNGEPVLLHDKDKLILADRFFKVSICEKEKEPVVVDRQGKWMIECPVCGKKYYGDTQDFRVSECSGSCSADDYDKTEIAMVFPKYIGE